jgi:hypothetical protein
VTIEGVVRAMSATLTPEAVVGGGSATNEMLVLHLADLPSSRPPVKLEAPRNQLPDDLTTLNAFGRRTSSATWPDAATAVSAS